ncbi:DNA gyrase inhibitor YacG [soil metagenome]
MTAAPRRCAVCSRPVESPDHAPFCSRRCADVDLQRWFSGRYVLPGSSETPPDAGEDEA